MNNYNYNNKKIKYISTLLHPENSKWGRIPNKFSTPTSVFKRRRLLEFSSNSNGMIGLQWSPQCFYLNNNGLFIYNGATFDGIVSTTPTSTGLGVDSSNFIPTNTPIRLVGASLKIIFGGGTSTQSGIFTGGSYETNISTNSADGQMNTFNQINSLKRVKTCKASDGLKIIYLPYDSSCTNFYKINTNLGRNGDSDNGLLNTQRFVFYGTQLPNSSKCIQLIFTQIFESIPTSDFFSPRINFLSWDPAKMIKELITDKNRYVFNLTEDNQIDIEIKNLFVKKDKVKKYNKNSFYFPEKLRNFRLPTIYGESTSLFRQNVSLKITTNSSGVFGLNWFPEFYSDNLITSQSGLYLVNNTGYDGLTGGTVTQLSDLDFISYTNPVFQCVRLVAASIKVIFIGDLTFLNGQFLGGINLESPPVSLPSATNIKYSFIDNLSIHKTVNSFDGLKIIYTPYDYSSFNFHPVNYLTAGVNLPTVSLSEYICGYGLPANSQCVKIILHRVFEGIPSSNLSDYFEIDSSKINISDCEEMTQKIINHDLIISNLIDESKINKLLK